MREKYEEWFRAMYEQEPKPKLGAPAHDFCYAGWLAGVASRDAEVAELKVKLEEAEAASCLGHSLFANRLVECDQLRAEIAAWRKLNERADKTVDKAEQERDQLREQVNLYEQALVASWPEGAMGDAFDFWNAARKLNTAEPKL